MDSKQRAEKIVTEFNAQGACLSNTEEAYLENLISAQIEEAERKAVNNHIHLDNHNVIVNMKNREIEKAREEGFNAAEEKAKKIAEEVKALPMDEGNDLCRCVEHEATPSMIADRIKAMEP